jgi:tetratricopeptide (TPR) repeat protein
LDGVRNRDQRVRHGRACVITESRTSRPIDMTVRPFLGSIPQLSWALPKHWAWTPEHLAEQIASRADDCSVSPVLKVDAEVEEWGRLRPWRQIARYCLKTNPDNANAWIVLGHAECRRASRSLYNSRRSRRRFQAAKRAYRVAAKLKRYSQTWTNLGEVGVYSGDLELQFSAFRTALEIDPTDAWARWRLGESHAKAGEHEKAVGLFRESLGRMGDAIGAVVCVDLALSDLHLGNVDEAMNSLIKSVNLDNGDYFSCHYPQIAEGFYDHDQAANEFRDRLSAVSPNLADRFYTFFQPRVGTVIYTKGYYRIKTTNNSRISYGDYFVPVKAIKDAGITKLCLGDQVAFHVSGRRVLANHFKLLSRAG